MLPFTAEQFFELFRVYNDAIWPVQPMAYGFGLIALACLFQPGERADRAISAVLALMWTWTGVAYHWVFFQTINSAASIFGIAFVAQGAIFLLAGIVRSELKFGAAIEPRPLLGAVFIAYSMLVYPLIGVGSGHAYAEIPQFGVTPCPVTLFTLGYLLLLKHPIRRWTVAIPVAWSLIGGSAAILLGVPQDWPLLLGGAIALWCMLAMRPVLLK